MTFGPISESPNINQKKVLLQLDMWRKNGFCKTRLKIHAGIKLLFGSHTHFRDFISIVLCSFKCHFVSLIQFSPFLYSWQWKNGGNEGSSSPCFKTHNSVFMLSHFFSLYFFMAELWTRSLQFCFSVHSDLLASYNLLQQPQKRGRKLEGGARVEPDSI